MLTEISDPLMSSRGHNELTSQDKHQRTIQHVPWQHMFSYILISKCKQRFSPNMQVNGFNLFCTYLWVVFDPQLDRNKNKLKPHVKCHIMTYGVVFHHRPIYNVVPALNSIQHGNRPVAQIPWCTILKQKCVDVCTFLLQNGALWDIFLMH